MGKYVSKFNIVILVVLFSLCGCGKKQTVAEEIKNGGGGAEMFVKKDLTNEIVDSINSDDVDRLEVLFSDYALNNGDYEEDIKKLYEMFPDDFEPVSPYCYYSDFDDKPTWKDGPGYENMTLCGRFDFTDENGKEYTLFFTWLKLVSKEPDKQGIHSITVASKEAIKNKDYETHGIDDSPGIYFYK